MELDEKKHGEVNPGDGLSLFSEEGLASVVQPHLVSYFKIKGRAIDYLEKNQAQPDQAFNWHILIATHARLQS